MSQQHIRHGYLRLSLLFGFAVFPYVWIAYSDYLMRLSGLEAWRLVEAKEAGEFDHPWSKVWTAAGSLIGLALTLPVLLKLYGTRRAVPLVASVVAFSVLIVLSTAATGSAYVPEIGAILRYLSYFVVVPGLMYLSRANIRLLIIPIALTNLIIVMLSILPVWDNINWQAVTYVRDIAGLGGAASAVGGAYLALALSVFMVSGGKVKPPARGMEFTSYVLFATFASAVFMIVVTFSRGAILALFVSFYTYFALKNARTTSGVVVYSISTMFIVILAISFSDGLLYLMSRQGALADIDAGRAEIWSASLSAAVSSPFIFVFGGARAMLDLPAHNMFLGILVSYGFLAFVSYCAIHMFAFALLFWRLHASRSAFLRDCYTKLVAVALGLFFFGNFENTFFLNISPLAHLYFVIIGLAVVGLERLVLPERRGLHWAVLRDR
jgi:hypothetical protein